MPVWECGGLHVLHMCKGYAMSESLLMSGTIYEVTIGRVGVI
jgi:hypothetical protein